ncbi:Integrase core domain protein [compost metagenome]
MRTHHKKIGVRQLCQLFGKTRLAYYDCLNRETVQKRENALVLEMVSLVREDMPGLGSAKLHYLLNPSFERAGIKMGRDNLHRLLWNNRMTVKRRRYRPRTTDSDHFMKKYPNRLRGVTIDAPNQLWVSDITYIRINGDFSYLSLITDAYSHKIIGYSCATTLSRSGPLKALKMALSNLGEEDQGIIHHSDRGSQYCCFDYILILKGYQMTISMTQEGDPRENAIAERINGILKTELGLGRIFPDHDSAKQAVDRAVEIYNGLRPHASCDYLTPLQAEQKTGALKKRWKESKLTWTNMATKQEIYFLANQRV